MVFRPGSAMSIVPVAKWDAELRGPPQRPRDDFGAHGENAEPRFEQAG
jgi:hypothetical protein